VDLQRAFLLRAFDELLLAIGAGVVGDVRGGGVRLHLRERGGRESRCDEGGCDQQVASLVHSDSFFSFLPLRKRSLQIFSHLASSSSVITGSIIWNGNLLRCVSTARLAGTRLRSLSSVWPSLDNMKSAKTSAACGRGAWRATPMALGRPKVGAM